MSYIDAVCWSVSSYLYLPQLAGVPFRGQRALQSPQDWHRKLHAHISPVIFSSLRKRKGSCFQQECFVLDFRTIPVYSPIYDFKFLTARVREYMGIKLCVCTTRGFLPCFWLLLMSLMQFLKLHISSQMGMFSKKNLLAQFISSFKAMENCVSSDSFQKWLVIDVKSVAASYYFYV